MAKMNIIIGKSPTVPVAFLSARVFSARVFSACVFGTSVFGTCVSSICTLSSTAAAEETKRDYVIDKPAPSAAADDEGQPRKDGIDWHLTTGATLNFSDNRNVVGQTDGSTLAFGFKLDSAIDYRQEVHELRNSLTLAAGISRTPVVPEFIKSQDALDYETIYLYHLTDWFGPFTRFAWGTSLFRGTDVRPELTDYAIARLDGSSDNLSANRLTLTDALMPSRLKESLGVFFQPMAEEPINLELRLGGGARHIFAEGQLAVADDEATDGVIEVQELADVHQLGAEAVFEVWGATEDKKVTYKAVAEVMMPFVHNELPAGDDRDTLDLTNLSFKVALSFKLVDWASLDYELKAVREPQLLDDLQLQNNLLLTLGLATGSEKKEPEAKKE